MPRFKVWCDRHQSWDTADISSSVPGNEICPNCGCEKKECNFRLFLISAQSVVPEEKEDDDISYRTHFCPSHGC